VDVKLSDDGVRDTTGVVEVVVPVPVMATVCGEPDALSPTESVAEKLVADAGVKVTEIEQLDPAASVLPQVLVSPKSVGFVPAIEMLSRVSADPPVFISVTVCAAEVEPTAVFGKGTDVGLN
jgi:hypothetical protein